MHIRRLATLLLTALVGAGVTMAVAIAVVGLDAVEDGVRQLFLGPVSPSESLPPAPPGSPLVITLTDAPRANYGPASPASEDALFLTLADAQGLEYDPSLGAAARELAIFYTDYRRLATSNALGFLLESSGAAYWGVRQSVVITNARGNEPIETLLAESTREGDVVGVGEDILPETPPLRVIVALTARRTLTLDPLPRAFEPGTAGYLTGRLAPGYTRPRAIAMSPAGTFVDLDTTLRGRQFSIEMPAQKGRWVVEILAEGPHGPVPLTQLTLYGGVSVPKIFETSWPPPLAEVTNGAEYVADLVNSARAETGLPALIYATELADVALAHSEDMRTGDFIGHRSPRTGLLSDRLRAARYSSVSRGENVALNGSLYDAHAGLMWSLGHRKNILSPQFTHLGVGARHGPRGWYLTEVFARPTPVIDDADEAAYGLLKQLRRARAESQGRGAVVRRDATLSRIARQAAGDALDTPEAIVSAVRQVGIRARTTVWTGQLATLEQFVPPTEVVDGEFTRFGVGIAQDLDADGPSIRVVLIAADG